MSKYANERMNDSREDTKGTFLQPQSCYCRVRSIRGRRRVLDESSQHPLESPSFPRCSITTQYRPGRAVDADEDFVFPVLPLRNASISESVQRKSGVSSLTFENIENRYSFVQTPCFQDRFRVGDVLRTSTLLIAPTINADDHLERGTR